MGKTKKILELWPFVMITIISWPLNVSWSIVPSLRGWGVLTGFWLFVVAEIMAGSELTYWRWFWGWLGQSIQGLSRVKNEIEFGKKTVGDLKKDHYVHKLYFDPIVRRYRQLANPDNVIIKLLRWGGYGMMFALAAQPLIPCSRIAGAFFCSVTKSKKNFAALLTGNFFYIIIVVWGWDKIFCFLGH